VARVSRTGLTHEAPRLVRCVTGRDLVRLSRLGPGFLRWVCARVERDDDALDRLVPVCTNRIDWAEMAQYASVWQAIQPAIPAMREARVPMWQWGVADAAPASNA
jgi:hypothetical protein